MNNTPKKILACVDGSFLSETVCDFGAFFSKTLKLPLELLSTIEHSHISSRIDLSGNIGLGARDDLLETLIDEEKNESKKAITEAKNMLFTLQKRAHAQSALDVKILLKHGELYENVQEKKEEIRLLILGLRGKDHEGNAKAIGFQVEELIRTLNIPILLVNTDFKRPKKILIAYDGSASSKKALEMVVQEPLLNDVERHILNVHPNQSLSQLLLSEACATIKGCEALNMRTVSLQGDSIEALLAYQEDNAMDMIAMGAFSHSRIRDVLFGSFTSKMIFKTPKPLLLLR